MSTILTLPGEIQNKIVANLDPFSVIALRYTCQHFKRTVPLPSPSEKQEHLHQIECSASHPVGDKFACYTCYRMKPRQRLTKAHTRGTRGKNGGYWNDRRCLLCLLKQGALSPGAVIKTNDGTGSQVFCWACSTLQREWCSDCKWCRRCTTKGWVRVYRKREGADPKGNAQEFHARSTCQEHQWDRSAALESTLPGVENDMTSLLSALALGDVSRVARSSLSVGQAIAMYDYEAETGEVASPEWFDGPDDI